MMAINFAISAYTAIDTGNYLGFAGGIIGGAVFGAIGEAIATSVSASLGTAAFSFGGGFLHGAIEFGMGGFGAGFGSALASGATFSDAIRAGGIGAAIGGSIGGVVQGSYMAGWQNSVHGSSRTRVYEAGIKRLHGLSVKANDKTTAIVGSRPTEYRFGHRYIRGRAGRFEMGPDATTGLIEINGENSIPTTDLYLEKFPKQVLETTTVVSQSGFNRAVEYYKAAWVDVPAKYSPEIYNSNYAVNTVLYGAGANAPENLGNTPQGLDPFN